MPVRAAFLAAALALCSALGALAPAPGSGWPAGVAAQPEAAQQAAAPSQAPRLRRLSLADAPGALVVMWSTGAPTPESCVQLWPLPAGPSQLAAGRPEVLRSSAAASGQRSLAMAAWAVPSAAAQLSAAAAAGASSPPPEPPPGADVRTLCGASAPFVEPSTNATSQVGGLAAAAPAWAQAGRSLPRTGLFHYCFSFDFWSAPLLAAAAVHAAPLCCSLFAPRFIPVDFVAARRAHAPWRPRQTGPPRYY